MQIIRPSYVNKIRKSFDGNFLLNPVMFYIFPRKTSLNECQNMEQLYLLLYKKRNMLIRFLCSI